MDLDEFFEVEVSQKPREKVLMYDFHNFMYRTIFAAQNEYMKTISDPNQMSNKQDVYLFWRNFMIANLFGYVKQFQPTKLIISVDCKRNWRKDIYPNYKAGRKDKLKESAVDFEEFYPIATEFIQDLRKTFPNVYVLEVENCETDDIIAVLAREIFRRDDVIILSTDGDFKQLLQNSNVRIFNPDSKVKNFVQCLNPKEELDLKVVIGDGGNGAGDNIPNILVMEGFEQVGDRTIGVGEKVAQKILENGIDSDFVVKKVCDKYPSISPDQVKEIVKKNYLRNLELISFDNIPMMIKERIIEAYKSYEIKPYNGRLVFDFLNTKKIRKVAEEFQIYSPFLKKIG